MLQEDYAGYARLYKTQTHPELSSEKESEKNDLWTVRQESKGNEGGKIEGKGKGKTRTLIGTKPHSSYIKF